jgi:hypothetical protein
VDVPLVLAEIGLRHFCEALEFFWNVEIIKLAKKGPESNLCFEILLDILGHYGIIQQFIFDFSSRTEQHTV